MASLKEIARQRKGDFRALLKSSRELDANQESLEREIKRLVNRKDAVPEAADAERIVALIQGTQQALNAMTTLVEAVARNWSLI